VTTERGTAITGVAGTGVPVRGDDIDTDRILPARFLKEVTFENMGEYAFYDRRFDADGEPTDHPFNEFEGVSILVVNANFGCGSSREHAPQALMRWGIDGIVGESFAEIFRDNCESLGVPTVTASREAVFELQDWIAANPDGGIELDIEALAVRYGGRALNVEMNPSTREALLQGIWDTTELLCSNREDVRRTAESLPDVES
jgi:3-isopropylmalate/(R)-2-methylmalate dehydratase small subunit